MGRVLAAFMLTSRVADLFASLALQNIYRETIYTFAPLVFIIVASMTGSLTVMCL